MILNGQTLILKGMKLIDLLLMIGAFASAAWIVHYEIAQVPFEELVTMRMKVENFILFMSIGWVWQLVFSSFGLYQINRTIWRKYEYIDVLKATTTGTLIIVFYGYLFNIELITPIFIALFWLLGSGLTILSRALLKFLLSKCRGLSNLNTTDGICAKENFIRIIEQERIRADRDNHEYSLLLISLNNDKQYQNELDRLLKIISQRVRRIDEIGWYDNTRVGVILPYTSEEGASKLAQYICESITDNPKKPLCEIYTYPLGRTL